MPSRGRTGKVYLRISAFFFPTRKLRAPGTFKRLTPPAVSLRERIACALFVTVFTVDYTTDLKEMLFFFCIIV